ncbi:putative acyl transferase acyl hydrolase lysophospholipase [Rosellinia necatrix]|uniref:Putative acyl transferase acyl hydrolase lysophospholipase n=1 Tax=Rosellinia necatrix TaxID=77044 RepID=A0A1W2TSG7_ROSNE|nr:putative acyl transferase acyl hydrolase lysophospholipase [Rosellinia necatrix]
MGEPETSVSQIKILSLDGGGVRGKSSLLILERIMETIKETRGLESVPRPCDHFDLIGGTSTGGIIAIMLGRLGMTVDECIRAYDQVAEAAFTPKRTLLSRIPAAPRGVYSAQALERAIKQTVRRFCAESQCVDKRRRDQPTVDSCPHEDAVFRNTSCTKTVVLAVTKDNVDAAPHLFTTYGTSTGYRNCTIWQVARATSAATTFFKSIKVGRDNVEFIDAGFGHNNPCEVLIEEAQRQFPARHYWQALSIGTGLGSVVTIKDSRWAILEALKKMASSSTMVATRLNNKYRGSDQYYRFNVERGLDDIKLSDWDKASRISAHTDNYLTDNRDAIRIFVDKFINCPQICKGATDLQSTTASGLASCYIPLPRNENFVGRTKTLQQLAQTLFTQGRHKRVCLSGLGGVGKTQIALKIAYEAKDTRGLLVIWLPAASDATFRQACTDSLKRLDIQLKEDVDHRVLLRDHLNSDKAGEWVLVIDNIDATDILLGSEDQPVGISDFLPDSDNGSILFTTRSSDIASMVAGSNVVQLKEMDPEEARQYLETKIQIDEARDGTAAVTLLNQLTYLPLAITQAAAFISRNKIPIQRYLELLHETESGKVDLVSWEFYDGNRYKDSQNAVALTWQISFREICKTDNTAAELLRFISRIEPKAIPRSMLPIQKSNFQLVNAIGTLIGYAFLDIRDGGKAYDMHSLVHLATRTWVKVQGCEEDVINGTVTHLATIFPIDDWENRHIWREYLPHALRVVRESSKQENTAKLGFWVGRCLMVDGRIQDAVELFEEVVSIQKTTLAKNHPHRLASQHTLAIAYKANGQVQQAVELLKEIVSIRKTTLAKDHPSRLASQHALAIAYQANGQVQQAVELLEEVVSIQKTTLAKDHPHRLASQHALAIAYQANGQVQQAVKLLEEVVFIEKTLAKDHPSRLASQHALAIAYQANGQVQQAVELLEEVVSIQKTLAKDHFNRLASQHTLAIAYQANGQVQQAVKLLEEVVSIRTALAKDHPDRLASQHALAMAYQANGQVQQAVKLLKEVVSIRTTLAKDHPDRLASQHVLAGAYEANGQVQQAVELLEEVVSIEKTLAKDHPSRLASQHELARAYQANGQVQQAVELLEEVVSIRKTTLSKDHPHRLASESLLRTVCLALESHN